MQMTDAEKQELKQIHEAIKNHLIKIGGRLDNNPMTEEVEKNIQADESLSLAFSLGQAVILGKVNSKLEKYLKEHNI